MNDSSTLTLFLLIIMLVLVLLLVFLTLRMMQEKTLAENLLNQTVLTLLMQEKDTSQSLLNQLRAESVPDLFGLQEATLTSNKPSETTPEAIYVQDEFDFDKISQEGLDDEFSSRGWIPPVVNAQGQAEPVIFDRNA